ncbi:acyl carrier protein [Kitasatospora sp. NPDC057015]|uniref:acyl carrier protein n=1 Tax=Kitasatospora sp. NPDC057015 TaxID=3346001 RepID=UPI00363BF00F
MTNQLPEEIRERIREIVAEILEADLADLDDEKSFTDDLEADSLLVIEIISRFERDLHIKIPMDDLSELDTLPEAYELVGRHYAPEAVGA